MPNYTTLLKTWGDTGAEYPTGYSYIEGEQPVDAWDNFLIHNVVKDLQSLIDTTNNDLLARNGGSLLSDLGVGSYGLVGDAGSVDFGGTEVTVSAAVDIANNLTVGGTASVTGDLSVSGNVSGNLNVTGDITSTTVKGGKPQVQSVVDLPDATQEELGTEYFVIDENKSYEVTN